MMSLSFFFFASQKWFFIQQLIKDDLCRNDCKDENEGEAATPSTLNFKLTASFSEFHRPLVAEIGACPPGREKKQKLKFFF